MAGRIGARVYRSSEWKRLRLAALQAANWRCSRCRRYGNECHHKVPLHLGGAEFPDLGGVEILCRSCHFKRHDTPRRTGWDALLTKLRGV